MGPTGPTSSWRPFGTAFGPSGLLTHYPSVNTLSNPWIVCLPLDSVLAVGQCVSKPEGPKAGPKGRKRPEGPPTRSRARRAHRLLVCDNIFVQKLYLSHSSINEHFFATYVRSRYPYPLIKLLWNCWIVPQQYDKESDHSYKAVRTCPQNSDGQ